MELAEGGGARGTDGDVGPGVAEPVGEGGDDLGSIEVGQTNGGFDLLLPGLLVEILDEVLWGGRPPGERSPETGRREEREPTKKHGVSP